MQRKTREAGATVVGNTAGVGGVFRRRLPTEAPLAVTAIAGQVFFTAVASLLPLVSQYGFLGDTISELAIGRHGYVQTAAFFAAGVGIFALAVGIRRATGGSWGSRAGSVLIGVYGAGAVLAGISPTDPVNTAGHVDSRTVSGTVHVAVAIFAFVSAVAGMFVLTRTFKRDARWRAFWPASLVLSFAALITFFLQGGGSWAGLYERIFVGTITLWAILVALRLLAMARDKSAGQTTLGKADADG